MVIGSERVDGITQREKRADGNDVDANRLQICKCSDHSRSGVDDVVHDGNAFAFDDRSQRRWEAIFDCVQTLARSVWGTLGVDEIAAYFERDQQGNERALDERPAYYFNLILQELGCKLRSERLNFARVLAQSLELEPQVSVMT